MEVKTEETEGPHRLRWQTDHRRNHRQHKDHNQNHHHNNQHHSSMRVEVGTHHVYVVKGQKTGIYCGKTAMGDQFQKHGDDTGLVRQDQRTQFERTFSVDGAGIEMFLYNTMTRHHLSWSLHKQSIRRRCRQMGTDDRRVCAEA